MSRKTIKFNKTDARYWEAKVAFQTRASRTYSVQIQHAGERHWLGLGTANKEEAAARAANEKRDNDGFSQASHYGWGGSGDGSRSADEMRALDILDLENDADLGAIKKAFRERAKKVHPDVKPGDADAAAEFQKLQLAYEVLCQADERREWKG